MSSLDVVLLKQMGLEPQRIAKHQERIVAAMRGEVQTTIPVVGACTVKNGGVVSWNVAGGWIAGAAENQGEAAFSDMHDYWTRHHLVTAIPAAGAASRFLGELQKFVQEFESAPNGKRPVASARMLRLLDLPDAVLSSNPNGGCECDCNCDCDCSDGYEKLRDNSLSGLRSLWRHSQAYKDAASNSAISGCGGGGCGGSSGSTGGCGGCGSEPTQSNGSGTNKTEQVYKIAKQLLERYSGVPKALVPTTTAGDTFLRLKVAEQISLLPSLGNVLIVPPGQVKEIEKVVQKDGEYLANIYQNPFELARTPFAPEWLKGEGQSTGRWVVMEQGKDLSTIRFFADGTPCMENNQYSLVAAGHGELVHLFGKIVGAFPQSECLHVRNIDNVVGSNDERTFEMAVLSDLFRLVRDAVDALRLHLDRIVSDGSQKGDFNRSYGASFREMMHILDFLSPLVPEKTAEAVLGSLEDSGDNTQVPPEALYGILGTLFHWPKQPGLKGLELFRCVQALLDRPVSLFGVVKKQDGDVGGGPVFVKLPDGTEAKLCMEMPHASEEDSKAYFGAGGKATHFNPVLTFFELRTHTSNVEGEPRPGKIVDFRHLSDDRFWLLSKKEFQGKSVCYHETVLYELIGNSATANLVFVEVPRGLFNPHKTFFDSIGRDRGSYGFDQTFGQQQMGDEEA